ncbi:MAG: RagB/SusD family nutrient uptake outer membrane protein [Muribaculaceae bacterium]|nr:RagB/SusD family nutrient uptake outer membrane protein [Muribaculaceae bacterium]
MKKSIIYGLMFATGVSMASCDHFLDEHRFPTDQQTDNPAFWENEINVQGEIDYFYEYFMGYGNGASWNGTFYYQSLNDDQIGKIASGSVNFADWNYLQVPTSNSVWSASYTAIRRANIIIQNVSISNIAEAKKNNFLAQARLNRAYQYYDLVRNLGDVPLVTTVLDVNSPELYAGRTPRNEVMDFVLEDLDFAINNISEQSNKIKWSVDLANAIKTEICLYEASYARYHQKDEARAKKFYEETVKAATPIIASYTYTDDYASIYNSTMDAADGMIGLLSNPEVILLKPYVKSINGHSLCKYTSTATNICGMTKDAFDAYLFLDGKPKASTTENATDMGVMDATGLSIQNLLDVRDKRLAAQIDPYVYYNNFTWSRNNSDPMQSLSGYGVRKFINPLMEYYYCVTDYQSYVNAPLFWLSKVALDYAEARAELGKLDDTDMNKTLNKLYIRAGLPTQTVASLSAMNDPANNMGVSSLLWEIRRCRRCELMFDGFRYWDLVRWHNLDLLDTTQHPNINLGANATPALADHPISNVDGYICSFPDYSRKFSEREYLAPLGSGQIALNPNLKQNPGW